jgi:hypothetical protein
MKQAFCALAAGSGLHSDNSEAKPNSPKAGAAFSTAKRMSSVNSAMTMPLRMVISTPMPMYSGRRCRRHESKIDAAGNTAAIAKAGTVGIPQARWRSCTVMNGTPASIARRLERPRRPPPLARDPTAFLFARAWRHCHGADPRLTSLPGHQRAQVCRAGDVRRDALAANRTFK